MVIKNKEVSVLDSVNGNRINQLDTNVRFDNLFSQTDFVPAKFEEFDRFEITLVVISKKW